MMLQILAETNNSGGAILGILLIVGAIWCIASLCQPRNKGWDVRHQGETTIKPRK